MYIICHEAGNTGVDYDNRQQPIFSLSGIVVDTDEWNNLNDYIMRNKIIIPEFLIANFMQLKYLMVKKCRMVFIILDNFH